MFRSVEQVRTFLHYILRLADIGSIAQVFPTYLRWARLLFDEQSKNLATPPKKAGFVTGQEAFMKSYVKDLVAMVHSTGLVSCSSAIVETLDATIAK